MPPITSRFLNSKQNSDLPTYSRHSNAEETLRISDRGHITDGIPVMMNYKHPLENPWSLWYFKNVKGQRWEDNLVEINCFDTIEDFWCLFNYVKSPSELPSGTDYYLFKKGIRPMWEDPANKKGGRWLIIVDKKHSKLDEYWLEIVMLMIGENFGDHNNEICGVAVNLRPKMDKIGVWTAHCDRSYERAIKHIGQTIRTELNIPREIYFQTHHESADKANFNKSMYCL